MKWQDDLRRSLRIAWPVIIGQLSYIALGVVDSMMVGRLGSAPLAAAALANGIFAIPLTFCFGLTAGIAPIAANWYAAKDQVKLGQIVQNGLWTSLFAGIIAALVMIGSIYLLPYLNQPSEVVEESIPYIFWLAASILPSVLFLHFKNFSEGLELMMPALFIGLVSVPLNAGLNYLFIFGPGLLPALGLTGAGIATFGTRIVMWLGMYYILRSGRLRPFIRFDWTYQKEIIQKILSIGFPAGIQYVFETGAFVIAAFLMGMIGEKELAAHQIAINIASIPFMVCIGLSAAGAIRMGNAFGNRNWKIIRQSGHILLVLTFTFMACSALIITITRHFLPTLYIDDQIVTIYASNMLWIAAIFQLSDGLQAVGLGLLRGLEDVKLPTAFALISYWIIAIPLGIYLSFYQNYGYMGIWWGLFIGLTISAILMVSRFFVIQHRLLKTMT